MPEGDTIWRAAAALSAALQGKRVVAARPEGLKRLAGSTVTSVDPVGKHLVIRFDSGWALHSHMRMRGTWQVYRPGERWRRPEWQLKAMLETADAVAVCFAAPVMELVRDARAIVRHLGPDILADDWQASEVVRRARLLPASTAAGDVLLDQRVTAGIGNVYRCEALWHRKVNPWTGTGGLSDEELAALFETARQAMRGNLKTWDRRFPGYGKGAVHGRGGRPCPRCGTPIKVRAMGEHARLVYWCPTCQPAMTGP